MAGESPTAKKGSHRPGAWFARRVIHGGEEKASLNNIHVYSTDGTKLRKALNKESLPEGIKLRELRGFVFGPDHNLYVVNAYFEYSQVLKFKGALNESGQHDFCEVFVKRHAESEGRQHLRLGQDSVSALERHRWPGNIRELKNVIERAVVVCTGDVIQPHHLSLQRRSYVPLVETPAGGVIRIPAEGKSLQAIVDEAIHTTIGLTGGNLSAAARILGISRPTLTRKLRDEGSVRRTILASS